MVSTLVADPSSTGLGVGNEHRYRNMCRTDDGGDCKDEMSRKDTKLK